MGCYGFRRPSDEDLGVNNVEISSTDLLKRLLDEWRISGKRQDAEDASKILSLLKDGKIAEFSFYADPAFGTTKNINDLPVGVSLERVMDSKMGFHVDISSSHTTRRLDKGREFDYDYRISINNDSNVSYNDIVLFVSMFEKLCKERGLPLNIKVIPDERDVFICYCKDDNLVSYIQILMDMSNSDKVGREVSAITRKFGMKKPFTSSVMGESYFGISSGLFMNELSSKIKGSIPVGDTMTSYSARLAENAYKVLLGKYDGDIDKIVVEEFYMEMHKEHVRGQFPDKIVKSGFFGKERIPSEFLDIPFWMNEHAYNMACGNGLERSTRYR